MIAIHEGLVRRYALLRLMFNGKTDVDEVKQQPGLIGAFLGRAKPRKLPPRTGAVGV